MIRQLRKQFIIVAMCSMFAVLAVIVGSLNVASYVGIVQRADRILSMLAENEGRFPDDYSRREQMSEGGRTKAGHKPTPEIFGVHGAFQGFTPETPYDTRFFSVRLDEKGEIVSVDTGRIAAVETGDAIQYAQEIWKERRASGFVGSYRYLNQTAGEASGERIIFVDCGKDLMVFRNLVFTSVGVSLLGLLAVFVLVFIFSGKVFAPVEESYRKQKRFITDASHELKTPLTVISANVDILELEGRESQWTASIRNQIKRLGRLTEQMVQLSGLEEEEKPVFTPCNLSEIVSETAAVFEPMVCAGGKRLSMEVEEGVVCQGDGDKLRQMIELLLENALKYASPQGEIRLSLKGVKKGGRARLLVWNTVEEGSGIVPGNLDMLFERFYRLDASRNSGTGGSGIGLSIVKAIVRQHGGRITAKSEDGKSISFEVLLP
ncbi:MAG: HAMP domain-containing histidine kinase [Acetatifactor sp.]|nr:HAMP domain-containing histidine kinase [Acetatifactor sp.]